MAKGGKGQAVSDRRGLGRAWDEGGTWGGEGHTMVLESVMGSVMSRYGHDAMAVVMTAHDTGSVMAQVVENQMVAKANDTMTLDSSKYRYRGK